MGAGKQTCGELAHFHKNAVKAPVGTNYAVKVNAGNHPRTDTVRGCFPASFFPAKVFTAGAFPALFKFNYLPRVIFPRIVSILLI